MEPDTTSPKDVLESALLDVISANGGSLPMSCFFMHRPELKKILGDKKLKDFVENECTKIIAHHEEERGAKVFGGQSAKTILRIKNSSDIRTETSATPVGRRAVNVLEKVVAAELERSTQKNGDRKVSVAYLSRNFKIRKKLKSAYALAPHPHLVNHPTLTANNNLRTASDHEPEKDNMTALFNLYLLHIVLENSDRFKLTKGDKDNRCEPPIHINDDNISKGLGCPCEIFVQLKEITKRDNDKIEEYNQNLLERIITLTKTSNPSKGVSIAWLGQDAKIQKRLQGRGLLDTLLSNPSDKIELINREGKYHIRTPRTLYGRIIKLFQYSSITTLSIPIILRDPLVANLLIELLLSKSRLFTTSKVFIEIPIHNNSIDEDQSDLATGPNIKRLKISETENTSTEETPQVVISDTKRRKVDEDDSDKTKQNKKTTRSEEKLFVEKISNSDSNEETTSLEQMLKTYCGDCKCDAVDLVKHNDMSKLLSEELIKHVLLSNENDKKRTITLSESDPPTLSLLVNTIEGSSSRTSREIPIKYIGRATGLCAIAKPGCVTTEAFLKMVENSKEHGSDQVISISRLDRNTSGVLPFSTSLESEEYMKDQYSKQTVHKKYIALCVGYPPETGRIENKITLNERAGQNRVRVCKNGKTAITEYKVSKRYRRPALTQTDRIALKTILLRRVVQGNVLNHLLSWILPPPSSSERFSLLNVTPHTGRTHQIRFHMSHKGHFLCSDSKYGKKKPVQKQFAWCPRHFLHCERVSGWDMESKEFSFECELAPDLEKVLRTQLVALPE